MFCGHSGLHLTMDTTLEREEKWRKDMRQRSTRTCWTVGTTGGWGFYAWGTRTNYTTSLNSIYLILSLYPPVGILLDHSPQPHSDCTGEFLPQFCFSWFHPGKSMQRVLKVLGLWHIILIQNPRSTELLPQTVVSRKVFHHKLTQILFLPIYFSWANKLLTMTEWL